MNMKTDYNFTSLSNFDKEQGYFLRKKKRSTQKDKSKLISSYFPPENKKKEENFNTQELVNTNCEKEIKSSNSIKNSFKNPTIQDFFKKIKQNDNFINENSSILTKPEDSSNSLFTDNFLTDKLNSTFCLDKFQIHSKNPIITSFNDNIKLTNQEVQLKKTKFKPVTEDYKITDYVVYRTYDRWRNISMEIFHEIFKFLKLSDICRSSSTCKEWHVFYKNIFTSYNFFSVINSNDYSDKEFKKLLQKGKTLKHISMLNEIIKEEFGNDSEKLTKENVVQLKLSKDFYSKQFYALDSFKIKHKKNIYKNFLGNNSIKRICQVSKFELKELSLIGCYKLTDKIAISLGELSFLEKLDLSLSYNLTEESLKLIFEGCLNLKTLCLNGLKVVGDQTIVSIANNLKDLEDLDISDTNVKGESLFKLRSCMKLKKLLMRNLLIKDNDLSCILKDNKNLITLSLLGKI